MCCMVYYVLYIYTYTYEVILLCLFDKVIKKNNFFVQQFLNCRIIIYINVLAFNVREIVILLDNEI